MKLRNLASGAIGCFAGILCGAALAAERTPAAEPAGTGPYLWMFSSSPVDPFVNVGPPNPGPSTLYLWYVGPEATTGACFGIEVTGATLLNVTSGGIWTDDCFSFTCLTGPVVVATLSIGPSPSGMDVCLAPHYIRGTICNFDCAATPGQFESSYIGFSSTGSVPCSREGGAACGTVATDRVSWGRVKGDYR